MIHWRKTELRDRFYAPAFRGMYDRFSDVIHDYVRAGDSLLDAGCGSGRVFQYRFDQDQRPRLIFGVDMTDEPRSNANIDAAARGDLAALPFLSGTFDIAISSHVAEHLTQPERVFGELARVLTPGGRLLVLTPNKWHYVTLSAALMPLPPWLPAPGAVADWETSPTEPTAAGIADPIAPAHPRR